MSQVGEAVGGDPQYRFTLYIAGDTDLSRRAETNLRQILESCLPRQYLLDVVDVVINPRLAIQDRVTITPMAVKMHPAPLRKVIGDFADRSKVLSGLSIDAANSPDKK